MFILQNREQLEKAILKAKKIRTQVKFIAFGIYSVRSSDGKTFYTVRCEKLPGGEKCVSCDCKGGQKDLVCFHSVCALSLHIGIARQREEVKL
jgi:hypothetical protein